MIRFFTITFLPEKQTFDDGVFRKYCKTWKVQILQAAFFTNQGKGYWTVCLQTEEAEKSSPKESTVFLKINPMPFEGSEEKQALYTRLRKWRKTVALASGMPSYIICRDQHFIDMINQNTRTLKDLERIHGFGNSKIQKYGQQILQILVASKQTDHNG